MSSIVAAAAIGSWGDGVPGGGELGVGAKVVLAIGFTHPILGEFPTDPVGATEFAIVGKGKLGLLDQVVFVVLDVSCCVTGIAEFQMIGRLGA